MTTRLTIIGFVLFLGAAIPSARANESGSAQEKFLAEYPTASKRLEDYYKHVKIYFAQNTKFRGELIDYEFFRNGDSIRLVELDGKGEDPLYAKVVDPDVIFRLKQTTFSSPFSVLDVGKGDRSDQKAWATLILSNAPVALAPFGAYLPGSIREFLSAKALRVRSVEQSRDGSILVEWEGVPPGLPTSRGSFSFLPDSCWALREYSIVYTDVKDKHTKQARPDSGHYGVVEYEGSDDGVPLIRRLRTWPSEGSKRGHDVLYEVKDIRHEIVPKQEFTLGAFAVRTGPAPPQIPIAYYLLALSAFCGLLVLVIRYLRNRSWRTSRGT